MQHRMNQFKRLLANVPVHITWADTAKTAIAALRKRVYDIISLDHDFGGKGALAPDAPEDIPRYQEFLAKRPQDHIEPFGTGDGLQIAQALVDTPNVNSTIFVHSMNPVGAMHMRNLLPQAKWIPFNQIWLEVNQIKALVRGGQKENGIDYRQPVR